MEDAFYVPKGWMGSVSELTWKLIVLNLIPQVNTRSRSLNKIQTATKLWFFFAWLACLHHCCSTNLSRGNTKETCSNLVLAIFNKFYQLASATVEYDLEINQFISNWLHSFKSRHYVGYCDIDDWIIYRLPQPKV